MAGEFAKEIEMKAFTRITVNYIWAACRDG